MTHGAANLRQSGNRYPPSHGLRLWATSTVALFALAAGGCAGGSGAARDCLCHGRTPPNLVAELSISDDPFGAEALGDRVSLAYEKLTGHWSDYTIWDCYVDRED